jgi:glycosyltransferase involved in cell wall biosynthesis
MRILHVLGKLDRGGVETWLVQVLRHIDRQKYQMDFLVNDPNPGAYDDEVRSLGARIIPCLGYRNPARYALNFWRILREYGPYDCVHSHVHNGSGYVLMLAAMAGVPSRIAQSHTNTKLTEASAGPVRRLYLGLMRRLLKRYASLGIAVSSFAGDSLMPGWRDDARWHLRPYGIESAPFDIEVDSAGVRARLGIQPGVPVVGHVGRFVEVKNHRLILEIAEELSRLDPKVVFLLVGDGPLRPEIEAEIRRHGMTERFVLAGLRADIPAILQGAMDAFLFPSLYEGLGIALMEAQLAGLRCVVSDVVPPEAELVPGMVSWISLSDSPKRWAESLHDIFTSEEVWNVSEEVRRNHSIETSVSQLAALYESDQRVESPDAIYQSAQ